MFLIKPVIVPAFVRAGSERGLILVGLGGFYLHGSAGNYGVQPSMEFSIHMVDVNWDREKFTAKAERLLTIAAGEGLVFEVLLGSANPLEHKIMYSKSRSSGRKRL